MYRLQWRQNLCVAKVTKDKRIQLIYRAKRAINKRYNLVDVSRRSLTYEKRLYKYSKRGFSVAVPGLDYDMIDLPKAVKVVYNKPISSNKTKANGLGKLIYYDLISRRVDSIYAAAATFRAALNKPKWRNYNVSDYNTPISRFSDFFHPLVYFLKRVL